MSSKEEQNKNDATGAKESTAEAGEVYTGDGTVVGDADRLGGEESLAAPPAPFVQYGGASPQTGDGMRRPGPFREKYQCPSMRFANLVAIPFRRVG